MISGSSTVEPISSVVAEVFNETNPDVQISVDGPGTGDGFELFCNGETDISDASRPIEAEEAKACKENGIEYIELEVALDGITVMTNPENSDVDVPQLRRPLRAVRPASPRASTTGAAPTRSPPSSAATAGFPDAPLDDHGPG